MARVAPASPRESDGIALPPRMAFPRHVFSVASLENRPLAGSAQGVSVEARGDYPINRSSVGVLPLYRFIVVAKWLWSENPVI